MMRIWCIVLVLNLLFNFGSTKPAELINADLSVSGQDVMNTASYGYNSLPNLISDNVGAMSSSIGSVANMATGSLAAAEAEINDATSYFPILDSVKSSIYDATSQASNLMGYTNLINNNPYMSLTDKAQFLSQLPFSSPEQLGMVSDLFAMLGDVILSHIEWKLKVIRAAKEQFDLGMQALENGDTETAKIYFYNALYTLPKMCPIYHALKYALYNDDYDMMSFVGKMGQLILGRMEETVDVSLSD